MIDISQQIKDIEEEIRKTPYHKGTEHHIGKLRARIARLKDRLFEGGGKGGGGGGGGYAVRKSGDATVALVGPPSAGKSTLLNRFTNAKSRVAEYAFTTVSVVPGMMFYKDAYIQIFDIPGLIEGAAIGKGRGKEVISVARNSDLLIIMSDVKRVDYIEKIVSELEGAGIRLNKKRPDVTIEKKPTGGIEVHTNITQPFSKEMVKEVAYEFGIKNADISIREKITLEDLIDSFSTSRVYLPAIFVINKIDMANSAGLHKDYIKISAESQIGLSELKEAIWNALQLTTVYLTDTSLIVKSDFTLRDVAEKIGTEFAADKKSAKIWGPGARFPGQEVSLATTVKEGMKIKFV